jgi:tetratricopeptide (TPR) repeat protein
VSRAAVALACLALAAAPAAAQPLRERALRELHEPASAAARRQAAQTLGEVGAMSDLGELARALRDADPAVRAFAESAMWRIWSRSGDEETDRLLALGIEQLSGREDDAAVETFSRVIQRTPEFAEGWNKRATAYYLLGEYEKSLADCDEVLRRNPLHFGALSGYGMIYLRLGRPEQALAALERALAVNPNLGSVRESVRVLRDLLLQQRRDIL